jgi:hypothetical protein
VIARLLKPHPKLLAQAAAKAAQQEKKSALRSRAVDSYRPAPRTRSEPQRLNDRALYLTWSKEKLLREADIRRLSYEHKDPDYLAEILLVNDRKFYEKREEYRLLSIKELFEEAEVETVSLTCDRYWDHDRLVSELVEKVARVTVARHNDLLRAEQVARRQTAQARVSIYADRPSQSPRILKTTSNSQKVRDIVLKKRDGSTFTRSTGTQPAAEEKKPQPVQRKAGSSREKAEDRSSVTQEVETPKDEGSQQNDSGYFSSHDNSPTLLSASTPSSIGEDDGDDNAMSINRSKERINTRCSKQEPSEPVANKLREEHANSKKRARLSEDKEEPEEKPSKRAKTSPDEPPRKRTTHTIINDSYSDPENVPPQPSKQNTKRKASEELTPESGDSASTSNSGGDRPKKKIAGKCSPKVQKTTKEPKKLRGITTAERLPGMVYKEYTDGSWGLAKRSAGARRGSKAAAERRYNYIK